MLDIVVPLILRSTTDEKEEIDLPVLRLTPEPVMPDATLAVTHESSSAGLPAPGATAAHLPSKDAASKDKVASQHQQPSSPNAIGQSLSQVSGVRPTLTHTNSMSKLPTYGVDVERENELNDVAKGIDLWGMDMFLVRELSNGHPLLTIFYTILKVSSCRVREIMTRISMNRRERENCQ